MLKLIYILQAFLLIFSTCQNEKMEDPKNPPEAKGCEKLVVSEPHIRIGLFRDPYTLKSASISSDKMNLDVSYSGGCNDHCFNLIWDRTIQESYPPQTSVRISHNANGDNCRQLISQTLKIDLTRMKDELKRTNIKEIVIKIEDTDKSLTYKF